MQPQLKQLLSHTQYNSEQRIRDKNDIRQEKIEQNAQYRKIQRNKKGKRQTKYNLGSNYKERRRMKCETWDYGEIKKIFKLYDEYGSQWKIMETQFVDRVANSIKNRFYTIIRTLLKILFREHPSIIEKLPHQIPSKIILQFFQGRQEYLRFKGFGKKLLRQINYNLESKQIYKLVEENYTEIIALYETIFDIKCPLDGRYQLRNRYIINWQQYRTQEQQQQEQIQNMRKFGNSSAFQFCNSKGNLNQSMGEIGQMQYYQGNQYQGIVFFVPIQAYFQSLSTYSIFKPL